MSGYWDAIDREARALPAAAQPRPRTRFEGDASAADDAELLAGLAEVDVEMTPPEASVETRASETPARQALAEPPAAPLPSEAPRSRAPAALAQPPAASPDQPSVIGTDPAPQESPAQAVQTARPAAPVPSEQEARAAQPPVQPAVEVRALPVPQAIDRAEEPDRPVPAAQQPERSAEAPAPASVPAQAVETVVAQPIAPAPPDVAEPPPGSAEPAAHEPSLTIEIGEIHIRIAPEHDGASPVLLRAARAPAAAPLDSFLRRSGEGRR